MRSMKAPFAYAPAAGFHDEALTAGGAPRGPYGELLRRMSELGLTGFAERVTAEADATGVAFGGKGGAQPFHVDPVPRLIAAGEWAYLEEGVAQRARALDAFVADVYGDQAIVERGRDARSGDRDLRPLRAGAGGAARAARAHWRGRPRRRQGRRRGPASARGQRPHAVGDRVPAGGACERQAAFPTTSPSSRGRSTTRSPRWPARCASREANAVLLSDGPANSAWYEHVLIAHKLALPLITLGQLEVAHGCLYALIDGASRRVDVVYRRTDEDRLTDERGALTDVGAALYEPLRAGTLTCVNGFGTGVADDKLAHAYVEEMIRFYLSEQPLLPSVHTYDLSDPEVLRDVLDRLGELVIKPRTGHGGHGVVVGPHADVADLEKVAQAVRRDPHDYTAQDTILLSRHPTVIDGRLEPRHVDLRPFVYLTPEGAEVLPGGLTRVALDRGALVVNSSQRGGGKDTWVLW